MCTLFRAELITLRLRYNVFCYYYYYVYKRKYQFRDQTYKNELDDGLNYFHVILFIIGECEISIIIIIVIITVIIKPTIPLTCCGFMLTPSFHCEVFKRGEWADNVTEFKIEESLTAFL